MFDILRIILLFVCVSSVLQSTLAESNSDLLSRIIEVIKRDATENTNTRKIKEIEKLLDIPSIGPGKGGRSVSKKNDRPTLPPVPVLDFHPVAEGGGEEETVPAPVSKKGKSTASKSKKGKTAGSNSKKGKSTGSKEKKGKSIKQDKSGRSVSKKNDRPTLPPVPVLDFHPVAEGGGEEETIAAPVSKKGKSTASKSKKGKSTGSKGKKGKSIKQDKSGRSASKKNDRPTLPPVPVLDFHPVAEGGDEPDTLPSPAPKKGKSTGSSSKKGKSTASKGKSGKSAGSKSKKGKSIKQDKSGRSVSKKNDRPTLPPVPVLDFHPVAEGGGEEETIAAPVSKKGKSTGSSSKKGKSTGSSSKKGKSTGSSSKKGKSTGSSSKKGKSIKQDKSGRSVSKKNDRPTLPPVPVLDFHPVAEGGDEPDTLPSPAPKKGKSTGSKSKKGKSTGSKSKSGKSAGSKGKKGKSIKQDKSGRSVSKKNDRPTLPPVPVLDFHPVAEGGAEEETLRAPVSKKGKTLNTAKKGKTFKKGKSINSAKSGKTISKKSGKSTSKKGKSASGRKSGKSTQSARLKQTQVQSRSFNMPYRTYSSKYLPYTFYRR